MKALDIEDILSINEIADLREQYEKDLSKIQEHDSLKKMKDLLLSLPSYIPEGKHLRKKIFLILMKLVENHFHSDALKIEELMTLFPLIVRFFNLDMKIFLREIPESLSIRCFPFMTTDRSILHSLDNYIRYATEPYTAHFLDKSTMSETVYAHFLILAKTDMNSCTNFIRKFPEELLSALLNTEKEFSRVLLCLIIEKSQDCESAGFFRIIQTLKNRGYRQQLLGILDSKKYISSSRENKIRLYLN